MRASLALTLLAVTACDGTPAPSMDGLLLIPEERICPVPDGVAALHMGSEAPVQIEEVQFGVGPFLPNARLFVSAGVTGDESIEAMANEHGYVTVSLVTTPNPGLLEESFPISLTDLEKDSFLVTVALFEIGSFPTGAPFYLMTGSSESQAIEVMPDARGYVTVSITVSESSLLEETPTPFDNLGLLPVRELPF